MKNTESHHHHHAHPFFRPERHPFHRPHARDGVGADGLHPHHRGHHAGRIHCSGEGHGGPHRRGMRMQGGHRGHGEHGHGGAHPGHRGGGGRGGRGGDGGSRRPLGRGDLRLLLLALIEQQPRHGYELIQLIGELFGGAYAPSPGVVYPTLALLEDMGLIAAEQDSSRKRYAITDAGREQIDANREMIDAAQARTRDSARRMAKATIPPPVREAMEQLKRALLDRQGLWTEEEAARVARILMQAHGRIDADDATA